MRDWPLLLASSVAFFAACFRFWEVDDIDVMVAILATVASALIGAFIYSTGRKDGP